MSISKTIHTFWVGFNETVVLVEGGVISLASAMGLSPSLPLNPAVSLGVSGEPPELPHWVPWGQEGRSCHQASKKCLR